MEFIFINPTTIFVVIEHLNKKKHTNNRIATRKVRKPLNNCLSVDTALVCYKIVYCDKNCLCKQNQCIPCVFLVYSLCISCVWAQLFFLCNELY